MICLLLIAASSSCKKNKLDIDTKGGELALLPQNNNIGIIVSFNISNPSATSDSIDLRWEEAIAAGMSVGRLQIDWPEIETSEGIYNKTMVENQLKKHGRSRIKNTFVNFCL